MQRLLLQPYLPVLFCCLFFILAIMPAHARDSAKKGVDLLAVDLQSTQTNKLQANSQPVAVSDDELHIQKPAPLPEIKTPLPKFLPERSLAVVAPVSPVEPPASEMVSVPAVVKSNTIVAAEPVIDNAADKHAADISGNDDGLDQHTEAAPDFVSAPPVAIPIQKAPTVLHSSPIDSYKIGPGDKIRVTVFAESELSAVYKVSGNGSIAMPLVGTVVVQGLDIEQAKAVIKSRLAEGFLVDPDVTVEVTEYRPFYIMGEIKTPGPYAYVDGMSVLEAVAISGGYTYRADKDDIEIVREGYSAKKPYEAKLSDKVMPGDIITVKERFF